MVVNNSVCESVPSSSSSSTFRSEYVDVLHVRRTSSVSYSSGDEAADESLKVVHQILSLEPETTSCLSVVHATTNTRYYSVKTNSNKASEVRTTTRSENVPLWESLRKKISLLQRQLDLA